ncbi:MAG: hypothetical protein H6741_13465 [Alphaproteobacteria bacterium]|nr:hypothetical protein [Alphaproteobacteria bacterium]
MPDARRRLSFDHRYNAAQADRIRAGRVPDGMRDKWFIYEEQGWLHVHRADTGVCVYLARLDVDGEGLRIQEAWVNDDRKQRRCVCHDYDAAMLGWVIETTLLGNALFMPPAPPVARLHD